MKKLILVLLAFAGLRLQAQIYNYRDISGLTEVVVGMYANGEPTKTYTVYKRMNDAKGRALSEDHFTSAGIKNLSSTYTYNEKGDMTLSDQKILHPRFIHDFVEYTREYDGQGREVKRTCKMPGKTEVVTTTWTAEGGRTEVYSNGGKMIKRLEYNPAGKLVYEIFATGSYSRYDFDEHGVQIAETIGNEKGGARRTYSYLPEYDALGHLIKLTLPTGIKLYYTYDTQGRVTEELKESAEGKTIEKKTFRY